MIDSPALARDESASDARLSDARFLGAIGLAYTCLTIALTLTISPYFALGWDVRTFIGAGWSLWDLADPFAMYVKSRAEFFWPYAYPPLHAALVALFLPISNLVTAIPESVLVRCPVIIFDVALAWMLHRQIGLAAKSIPLARLAALIWLFNPVTIYQTAVQAHFESEWVFLVLVAFVLAPAGPTSRRGAVGLVMASVALAAAILIKQIALIFAVPVWMLLWMRVSRQAAVASVVTTATLVAVVCLPFALRSADFVYMVTRYVSEMPVQTQSALVWLLLIPQYLTSSHTSSIFLLQYATPIIAVAGTLASWLAIRSGRGLHVAGLLVTLAFFVLSPKVMAYYYVILIPFLLLVLLPAARVRAVSASVALLAWIMLSPYYASWAEAGNAWIYATAGSLNTIFFVWLAIQAWQATRPAAVQATPAPSAHRTLAGLGAGLLAATIVPILAQPAHAWAWAPGRVDLSEAIAAVVLLAATLATATVLAAVIRRWSVPASVRAALAAAVLYFALTFMQFYVTRESTRILEALLAAVR